MDMVPFHPGELRAQELAGGGARQAPIRDFMPDQHRSFFEALPFAFITALDEDGWPVASVVSGNPGFLRSPDPRRLDLMAAFAPEDPITPHLQAGASFGLLGLDFATRRRNRANGVIARRVPAGLSVEVQQSFGNCPQYIHVRELVASAPGAAGRVERFGKLDAAARAMLRQADTIFVASRSPRLEGRSDGLDISHRGGPRGFLEVEGDVVTVPDYRGNRYYNTLGNLLMEPRGAMLVVDFASGDVLQLQGRAEILWDLEPAALPPGAQRVWRFTVERGVRRRAALPLRWGPERA